MSELFSVSKIVNLPVDELVAYEKNARTHSEKQLSQLKKSIEQNGFLVPIIIDEENLILAGHGRAEAARRLGMNKVPCVKSNNLTEEQKRAFILADNKISDNAGWDDDLLSAELAALQELDFELGDLGFSDAELKKLDVFLDADFEVEPEKPKKEKKKKGLGKDTLKFKVTAHQKALISEAIENYQEGQESANAEEALAQICADYLRV